MILGDVEKMGKRIINNAELKEIQSKLTMENDTTNKCMVNNDQMMTILISMLTDKVAGYLMTWCEVGVASLDEMEVALQEHMMKIGENSLKSKSGSWVAQGGECWIRIAMK